MVFWRSLVRFRPEFLLFWGLSGLCSTSRQVLEWYFEMSHDLVVLYTCLFFVQNQESLLNKIRNKSRVGTRHVRMVKITDVEDKIYCRLLQGWSCGKIVSEFIKKCSVLSKIAVDLKSILWQWRVVISNFDPPKSDYNFPAIGMFPFIQPMTKAIVTSKLTSLTSLAIFCLFLCY